MYRPSRGEIPFAQLRVDRNQLGRDRHEASLDGRVGSGVCRRCLAPERRGAERDQEGDDEEAGREREGCA